MPPKAKAAQVGKEEAPRVSLCEGRYTVENSARAIKSAGWRSLVLEGLHVSSGRVVFLKISPQEALPGAEDAERRYYATIVRDLQRDTPHLVQALETDCQVARFEEGALAKAWRSSGALRSHEKGWLLVVEAAAGASLWDRMRVERVALDEQQALEFDEHVLAQVAQTLSAFAKYRFKHNDLHLSNVFVEIKEQAEELPYTFKQQPFSSRYFVRLLDFDFASTAQDDPLYPPNESKLPGSRDCRYMGRCAQWVAKWDWYFFCARYLRALKRFARPLVEALGVEALPRPKTAQEAKAQVAQLDRILCVHPERSKAPCVLDAHKLLPLMYPQDFLRDGLRPRRVAVKLCKARRGEIGDKEQVPELEASRSGVVEVWNVVGTVSRKLSDAERTVLFGSWLAPGARQAPTEAETEPDTGATVKQATTPVTRPHTRSSRDKTEYEATQPDSGMLAATQEPEEPEEQGVQEQPRAPELPVWLSLGAAPRMALPLPTWLAEHPHVVRPLRACNVPLAAFGHEPLKSRLATALFPRISAEATVLARPAGAQADESVWPLSALDDRDWTPGMRFTFQVALGTQLAQTLALFAQNGFVHGNLVRTNLLCELRHCRLELGARGESLRWESPCFVRLLGVEHGQMGKAGADWRQLRQLLPEVQGFRARALESPQAFLAARLFLEPRYDPTLFFPRKVPHAQTMPLAEPSKPQPRAPFITPTDLAVIRNFPV